MFGIASSTSARDSRSGLPCSKEQSTAYSLMERPISSVIRTPSRARSRIDRLRIMDWAPTAASTAAFASWAVPIGNEPRTSPEAGLTTSKVRPLSESDHFPSMYIRKLRVVEGFVLAKSVGLPVCGETAVYPNIVWCATQPGGAGQVPASAEPSSQFLRSQGSAHGLVGQSLATNSTRSAA